MRTTDFKNIGNDKNNFGLLRLLAAYFVLISHSFAVLQIPDKQPALWYNGKNIIFSGVGLSIFFTISGFLVTQSLFASDSLKQYLWKRLLRIIPALIVANLVCVIGGCLLTSLSIGDYFSAKETWTYLLKNSTLITNQFYLPGVFGNLKDHTVNASLWTILIEVEFYLVLCFSAYLIVIKKWLYLSCFVLFEALRIYMTVLNNMHVKALDLYAIFTFGTYFYLGSLFFIFKDNIRFKWFYANILMAIALITVYTFLEAITISIFFAYCFIIIGTSKAVINLKGFDVSYGVYLCAFPIQQIVVSYFGYSMNAWLHVAISALFATVLGFLSWIFVEKPFLKKKLIVR
ncbi:acyltransferase family protein [Segetibacter aerophilus]|uniref:Acyltransferase n=1 Tax=Segetibacter aerophilus TaxID=670293 RepID=A0A512BGG5_9BACT|nr:acyltransferase [Segetibacter aerophilus]GEO11054.1 acyltransferase [Segetibacter aerophilus]